MPIHLAHQPTSDYVAGYSVGAATTITPTASRMYVLPFSIAEAAM
jgi:hypothetical protein